MKKLSKQDLTPGFTTIEVVTVLVIIGIVSALAVSRLASTASFTLASEVDTLKVHLRYAQFRSLSDAPKSDVPGDDGTWTMSFSTNSYTLQRNDGSSYTLPNESSATHTLPDGFTLTGSNVTFDAWGSPGTSDITITLSSGDETKEFNITKNTGFIP